MTKSVEQSAAGGVASFWSQMEALVELFKGRRLTEVFRHVSFVPHEPYGPHAHRRIEINYVRRGSCFMECGGQTQCFRQGELMIVTPQAPHRFEAGPRGAVLMQLEFLPEVFLALGFRPDGAANLSHPRVVKVAGDVEISGTVRRIIAELQRRRPDSIHLVVLLYAELLLLLRRHLADSMSAAGAPAALRVATDFVRQNYGAPLAVADVARRAGGRVEPLYPCLTPLRCRETELLKTLAGLRVRGKASLWDGGRLLACEEGEVQFADYGLSGICIMQLSGLLAPGRGPKKPAVALDLFPTVETREFITAFARRAGHLPDSQAFWQGLLDGRLGAALWAAAGLTGRAPAQVDARGWQALAEVCKGWRFEDPAPCGWKQAQTTGGGLSLEELEPDFQFKGCPGLYFVGETLDCAGSCGGFNLHWAFGSGLVAGRAAARQARKR